MPAKIETSITASLDSFGIVELASIAAVRNLWKPLADLSSTSCISNGGVTGTPHWRTTPA
jgi:hypothetical protein